MSSTTVIAHFYNEEYLLPWWLRHHTHYFNHGILINRNSTDRSVDICRQLAPHWELRNARVNIFDAAENDQEIMEVESGVSGWKIVLNITEFFCCRNMLEFVGKMDAAGAWMYKLPGFVMVDDPNVPNPNPNPHLPLVEQRHHGFEDDLNRGRFIHKNVNGAYEPGRHLTAHNYVHTTEAFIKWFGFSPWNKAMRRRKLQIQPTMSEKDKQLGRGWQHLVDGPGLEALYRDQLNRTGDLRLNPIYQEIFPA